MRLYLPPKADAVAPTTFNSLFEMQKHRGAAEARRVAEPFNSLFEMRDVGEATRRWLNSETFNSLFEMQNNSQVPAMQAGGARLSILYLRCCSVARPGGAAPPPCAFNSLFEMLLAVLMMSMNLDQTSFQFSI